jgi:hypothetical protein
MQRIGVLSDTHGHWDDSLENFFTACDEIWHAGDIGNAEVADRISSLKHLRAVYGNIDDFKVRSMFPKIQRFTCEGVDVLVTHIGGYPTKYDTQILPIIKNNPPNLFICGHSHILKVIYDKKYNFLHINPGAAGKSGFHNIRTAVRFAIDGTEIRSLEILEIPRP